MNAPTKLSLFLVMAGVLMFGSTNLVFADLVPEWVKNTAMWYGEGKISEREFLDAIKFLIENKIIIIEEEEKPKLKSTTTNVIIPNGNHKMGNTGFYLPLHVEIAKGTTVVWINDDVVGHTIQSQDGEGHVVPLFNSNVLKTGDRFAHKFTEDGVYNYFCTLHPWRVGVITVK